MDYRSEVQRLNRSFQQHQGKYELLKQQWKDGSLKENALSNRLENAKKARIVIQTVAQKTQQNLEYHISDLISLALAAVWSDPYKFVAKFVKRSNKTVCDLLLERNGVECDPIEATGGGVCDVVSFALQISYLLMKSSLRRTIIGDESFSYLHSPELQRNCSEMLKTLSERTKMQIILISGQSDITAYADKEFKARLINGVTEVKAVYKQPIIEEVPGTVKKLKR